MKKLLFIIVMMLAGYNTAYSQSLYDKFVNKVIEASLPAGTRVDPDARAIARDAGLMAIGNSATSDAALQRIKSKIEQQYQTQDSNSDSSRGPAVTNSYVTTNRYAINNTADSAPSAVLQKRPKVSDDTFKMKNGDIFQGKVTADSLSVTTAYGQITVPLYLLTKVAMTGEKKNIETLISVGGDRFSGFLMEQAILVTLPGGNPLKIRKERVQEITLQQRAGKTIAVPDQILMRNTDIFLAQVTTDKFILNASYGKLTFNRADIKVIEFEGEDRVIGKITLRDNKGTFQGVLQTEEIAVKTRAGQELNIFKDKFQKIEFSKHSTLPSSGQVPHITFNTSSAAKAEQARQAAAKKAARAKRQHQQREAAAAKARQAATAVGTTYASTLDAQGFMVRKSLNVKSALSLSGAAICILVGSTAEQNISDYFRANKMYYTAVAFEKSDEAVAAYDAGRCDVYSTDLSGLYAHLTKLKDPSKNMILPEVISKH